MNAPLESPPTTRDASEAAGWRPAPPPKPAADATEEALYEVRRKIYPRSVTGAFSSWRVWLVILTQLVYYGTPWLQWNDRQAVLFDLGARKFYIFGLVLWPQDVIYLALLLVISALALFLFTAIAGRLFCGYACPQTVYTEIFMWIERRVEGDRIARIRLDGDPWSLRKIRLKATKHTLWIAIALWTGFTFIGYFAPIRELGGEVLHWTLGPWQGFWMLFYAFATWGNAGFMREQVCKYMCPYARFQSVMVDRDTYVVTYDVGRGDPRGSRSRKADHRAAGLGDCVNCSICVQVCPTGIDIRDGLQYECIGCGACIDACDQVMDKMAYPRGLIRYTSENAMRKKLSASDARKRLLRPRTVVYSAIWLALTVGFVASLAMRAPLKVDIIRDRGALGREVEGRWIENVYRLQLINATEAPMKFHVQAQSDDLKGLMVEYDHGAGSLSPTSNRLLPIRIRVPIDDATQGTHKIEVTVTAETAAERKVDIRQSTSFIVPRNL
ncbi:MULTISPECIES: cytochrome c oxidase accessory protein CcoG [unclassified Cupriavidus]|uniref:cytochrome c oxidase accessory protein CcoG n=1 Tax=unclassified Cupriavidus TaxID=2640874 RepID=UPI001C005D23|nr:MULTISPECIES: cytochrome c oxidase accessory protein CcoG [unclassified Cupriavidus]MCA3193629.1 cytochrome c oxidase accessory protein CcoG [Cupriavidus sp.]MCA3200019.1 cytochrome c oxidase accessory protein CcoG [Cupriavidus sp.]MCA3202032.1 cytochrome c oxidase accessory protein CcoG [Cupriavidus sp.]MCA3205754.1 cytochrome c oxidase accessory protein CcoG [Cupriavidus sp.]QWE93351.1 cytochrome c oxidase accessory protein CcoG [Cupriavidus sp. EM10]